MTDTLTDALENIIRLLENKKVPRQNITPHVRAALTAWNRRPSPGPEIAVADEIAKLKAAVEESRSLYCYENCFDGEHDGHCDELAAIASPCKWRSQK